MIDIVIVNWNSGTYLAECLESIEQQDRNVIGRIVVIDNASNDGSVDSVEGRFNLPLTVIRSAENLGFAAGCNLGARSCEAPYLLFLNPDTRLLENALARALAFMKSAAASQCGIVGIQVLDEAGRIVKSCARFPELRHFASQVLGIDRIPSLRGAGYYMNEWDHSSCRKVDQVIGAFFMVRHELFNSLGGFDERFFVYFEEVDFAYRAALSGYGSVYLTCAQMFHVGGGCSNQIKARRLFYSLRSRLLFGFKHYSRIKALLLGVLTLIVEPAARCCFGALKMDREGILETLRAYRMLYGEVLSSRLGRAAVHGGSVKLRNLDRDR